MESDPFASNHLQSQALVVLSGAASGLHEALRNQRQFQSRLSDGKDLHNMSFVGSYGSHLLQNFHPHLLQTLNPSMLSTGNGHGNFFANDGKSVVKPMLSSFQLPSAFSPPKYIGLNLEQNLFSGNESFRTDSSSPTCTSVSPPSKNDSLEGQMVEYDSDKVESPRSNSDSREFRHAHHIKSDTNRNPLPDTCPVCGIQLSSEEWNAHFLTELDRLYKLSSGVDHSNMLFGLCLSQDNSIRTSHNRWETFQRIRTNRQSRLRIKVRKRKCGNDLYFLESLFCSSCPICRRKYPLEKNIEEAQKIKDEIETVDVESCSDDIPDSGSDLSGSNKMDGVLYKTVCLINKENGDDISSGWEMHSNNVKNINELSSTTPQYYNADSCSDINEKDSDTNVCSNESDEDVIVDDDNARDCNNKRKFEQEKNNIPERTSTTEDEQNSEPQVTSTDTEHVISLNMYSKSNVGGTDMRTKQRDSEIPSPKSTIITAINVLNRNNEITNLNVDINKTSVTDDEYKCFICKV